MTQTTFKNNGIMLNKDFFETIKAEFLSSRDTFDKMVFDILNNFIDQINKNSIYIEIPHVARHERAQFHLFARSNLEIYSVGEEVQGYGYRTLIIQPNARYINGLIKKYKSPEPVVDISGEITRFKKLVIQDIEDRVETLISQLTI